MVLVTIVRTETSNDMEPKTIQRIEQLSSTLSELDESIITDIAIEHNYQLWDGSTDAQGWFECDVSISEQCGEYQVIRKIGIEMREYPTYEHEGITYNEIDEPSEEKGLKIDSFDYDREVNWMEDYFQTWINMETGEIAYRLKRNEQGLIDSSLDKFVISDSPTYIGKGFLTAQAQYDGSFEFEVGHCDISLHPYLERTGYKQYSGQNSELNGLDIANVFRTLVTDHNAEMAMKLGGDLCFHMIIENSDEHYTKELFAALKIANRNNYHINSMWCKLVNILIQMGRDVHNPKYVCPVDLKAAYIEADKAFTAKKLKFERKNYKQRISKYSDIHLWNSKFHIFVCPTIEDMKSEGFNMEHCVFTQGYYKADKRCLILLVRDHDNNRIATTRLQIDTWSIAETRGFKNGHPLYKGKRCINEINKLIMDNISRFINAGKQPVLVERTQEPQRQLAALHLAA